MLTFIVRRIIAGFFIVLGATFIAYILVANAGDPLAQARQTQDPAMRENAIKSLTQNLHLNVNPVARYFIWLRGIGGCFVGACDFGKNIQQGDVTSDLGTYMGISLKLIFSAIALAIIIGLTVGIVTAIKQYSGFDYAVTFLTFLFFSLPVFWVGIVLKDLVAIKFNNFLQAGAVFSTAWIVILAVFFGLVAYSVQSTTFLRKITISAIVAAVVALLSWYISSTGWLLDPKLGIVVVAILAVAIAAGVTSMTAGIANKKAFYSALTTAAVGVALYYPLLTFFHSGMSLWKLLLLLVIAIVVGIVVGYLWGGDDRSLNARTGALTALGVSIIIFIDRLMRAWQTYSNNPEVGGRPLATASPSTPNLIGDFWIQTVDTFTHLLLPTLTLMLISVAGHSRYARASMLEVLNQDYIRTARSKGLTERTVIMRHAFRNALIPITTIIAFDISGLLGGAVVTERVYGWTAMGTLFQNGLTNTDPNPVMAFFLVNAILAVLCNMLADISYAALDPRIRVGS